MNCKIVGDLLPLYHDNVVSDESRKLVEDHLASCSECSKMLDDMRENAKTENAPDIEQPMASGLKTVKKRLRRRTVAAVSVSIVCAVAVASALAYGVFFHESPVSHDDLRITSTQQEDNAVDFISGIRGHNSVFLFIKDDAVYFCCYDTIWTRFIAIPSRSMLGLIEAPAAPAAPAAPIAPNSFIPSPGVPPTPPEPPSPLLQIAEATKVYYIEGSPRGFTDNRAATERAIEDAVLLWEK